MSAGQKAISNATFTNTNSNQRRKGGGRGSQDNLFVNETSNQNSNNKKQYACYKMRDTGSCPLGKECPYSHDSKIIAEAKRKQQERKDKKNDRVAAGSTNDAVAETKGGGKGKNGGSGNATRPKDKEKTCH